MSNLGMMVMLKMMFVGNEDSVKVFKESMGKTIAELKLIDSKSDWHPEGGLMFAFSDGTKMRLVDQGQSCCELRYMHTDDKLEDFVGAKLLTAEIRDAPDVEDEYGEVHEVQFLVVGTSLGVFTVETHNEHNGYYGGFWIVAEKVE